MIYEVTLRVRVQTKEEIAIYPEEMQTLIEDAIYDIEKFKNILMFGFDSQWDDKCDDLLDMENL